MVYREISTSESSQSCKQNVQFPLWFMGTSRPVNPYNYINAIYIHTELNRAKKKLKNDQRPTNRKGITHDSSGNKYLDQIQNNIEMTKCIDKLGTHI